MHDGAPAHYMGEFRNYLNEVYPNRWIGRRGLTAWPPRSPDFNPLDYQIIFFWGYSKECVYHNGAPANVYELRDLIRDHARNVPQEMVYRTTQDILRRAHACIEQDGGPFEHCRTGRRARDNAEI